MTDKEILRALKAHAHTAETAKALFEVATSFNAVYPYIDLTAHRVQIEAFLKAYYAKEEQLFNYFKYRVFSPDFWRFRFSKITV